MLSAQSILFSQQSNPPTSRIFLGPIGTSTRKRREEKKISSRKSKILNYNPYAPFPLHISEQDYYSPDFVQNFQDPIPETNWKPDSSLLDTKQKIEKRTPLFKSLKLDSPRNSFYSNQQKYLEKEELNENVPHYYNPNAYKKVRPPILQNPHTQYSFPSIPNPISGFVPNIFPPKGHNHHFFPSQKDNPSVFYNPSYNPDISDKIHTQRPLEIREFLHPPILNGENVNKNEFSIIPNAAVLIPSEFSHKNKNVNQFKLPGYGLLVYNPKRGPPHYLIPVSPDNNHLELKSQQNPNNYFDLDSSRSSSEPQIIYGERFTGKNYFFGRKTKL